MFFPVNLNKMRGGESKPLLQGSVGPPTELRGRAVEIELLHWRREQDFGEVSHGLTENAVLRRCDVAEVACVGLYVSVRVAVC